MAASFSQASNASFSVRTNTKPWMMGTRRISLVSVSGLKKVLKRMGRKTSWLPFLCPPHIRHLPQIFLKGSLDRDFLKTRCGNDKPIHGKKTGDIDTRKVPLKHGSRVTLPRIKHGVIESFPSRKVRREHLDIYV